MILNDIVHQGLWVLGTRLEVEYTVFDECIYLKPRQRYTIWQAEM